LKVGGAPIGSQQYVDEFLKSKQVSFQNLSDQIADFGDQPYVGLGLLQNSLAKPKHTLSLIPPRQTRAFARDVDAIVWDALMKLLASADKNVAVLISDARMVRAKEIAFLPEKMNGLGLPSMQKAAAPLYLSSLLSCCAIDEDLAKLVIQNQSDVSGDMIAARDEIMEMIEDPRLPIRVGNETYSLLVVNEDGGPDVAADLIENLRRINDAMELADNHADGLCVEKERINLRLLKRITQAMNDKSIRSLIHNFVTNQDAVGSDLSRADIVAAAHMIKSSRNLFLRVDQTKKKMKMPARHFVTVIRQILMLPQDPADVTNLRNGRLLDGQQLEYATEACNASGHCYGQPVDLHGCHANGNCAPSKAAVGARHTSLKRNIIEGLKEAGMTAVKDAPPTAELLLHEFSEQQCRALFPVLRTEARSEVAETMLALTDEYSVLCKKVMLNEEEARRKEELVQAMHDIFDQTNLESEALKTNNNKKFKGLRLDVSAIDHKGDQFWIDVTCGSGLSTGLLRRAKPWADRVLRDRLEPTRTPSGAQPQHPRLVGLVNDKGATYAPMMRIATRQKMQRLRDEEPILVPAAITAEGILSKELVKFIKLVKNCFRDSQMAATGNRRDRYGRTLKQRVNTFATDFKAQLVFSAVANNAAGLAQAGGHWRKGSAKAAQVLRRNAG
jgi:hypothetical protein